MSAVDTSDYGLTPAQYHAGLDKLWAALKVTGVQELDVFTLCANRIAQLKKQLSDEQQWRVDAQRFGDQLQAEVKLLREFVKAKDEYIACYKLGKRPTEGLFKELDRLAAALKG